MAQQPGRSPAKYRQIAADLLKRIEAGEYPVGSLLPTKPELIASYGASLGTIDSALDVLRNLGMVQSRQGVGTFVIRRQAQIAQEQAAGGIQRQISQLADRVESLELNLANLYGKQGYDYPRDGAAQDEDSPDRAVAHDGRA